MNGGGRSRRENGDRVQNVEASHVARAWVVSCGEASVYGEKGEKHGERK